MRLQFLGSGDAFGSGGRFNMCILVESEATRFLVDCGASSLIAMKRLGVSPNSIDTILITHLHADHFGGLPFFILNEQFLKTSISADDCRSAWFEPETAGSHGRLLS